MSVLDDKHSKEYSSQRMMSTSALFDQMFAVKNQFFTFETLMKLEKAAIYQCSMT